jgi:hypothetical protein
MEDMYKNVPVKTVGKIKIITGTEAKRMDKSGNSRTPHIVAMGHSGRPINAQHFPIVGHFSLNKTVAALTTVVFTAHNFLTDNQCLKVGTEDMIRY